MFQLKNRGPAKKVDFLNRNIPACPICGEQLVRSTRYYEPPFIPTPDTCPEHGLLRHRA